MIQSGERYVDLVHVEKVHESTGLVHLTIPSE